METLNFIQGGDIVESMRRMAYHDKQKLKDKGIISPDLSKAERSRIDSRTITFKVRTLIHQPRVYKHKAQVKVTVVEPLFDND